MRQSVSRLSVSKILWGRRALNLIVPSGLLLAFGLLFAQPALAQGQNPLQYFKNYFLTGGDYVVGGWQKNQPETVNNIIVNVNGASTSVPYVTGIVGLPDAQAQKYNYNGPVQSVPAGANVVAAFLYWQTVESSSQSAAYGQTAFLQSTANNSSGPWFTILGTPLKSSTPVGWSSGGCTGSSGGSKNINTYRADVLRYLDIDPNTGDIKWNSTYNLMLSDAGSNGNTAPLTLGATLVMVYRDLTLQSLNAVVIYDGSYAASNQQLTTTQPILGFYQPAFATQLQPFPVAKFTQIAGNGQANKNEFVSFSTSAGTPAKQASVNLPSLYSLSGVALPPFPGVYNNFWDNPTWEVDNAVVTSQSLPPATATTVVTPDPANPGCLSWGAMIFKTNVQDTDGDGLLDIWESYSGLKDPNGNPLPDIYSMGADPNVPDIFLDVDYMTGATHTHLPSQAVLDMVGDAFYNNGVKRVNVHFDIGPIYNGLAYGGLPGPPYDPYIIQTSQATLEGGNAIPETPCDQTSPDCIFPDFPGTVGWKMDFLRLKNGVPTTTPPVSGYFDHSRKDTFHYVLFAHTLGLPRLLMIDGSLAAVSVTGGVATVTTNIPHNLTSGNFVSISGAPASANINGVYTVARTPAPTSTSFTIQGTPSNTSPTPIPGAVDGVYMNAGLGVGNGVPRSNSGVSDLPGGDLMVTLGRWDNNVGSPFLQASTLMHELGHDFFLGHAGNPLEPNNNNCKPNYQSVMSYLYQVSGLLDANGVAHIDYSGVKLPDFLENPVGGLVESQGLGFFSNGTAVVPPYLPQWYAPAGSKIATNLGITANTLFYCNGMPIPSGAPGMVRAFDLAPNTLPAIDWNWNGTATDTIPGGQDLNFNGTVDSTAFDGWDDWTTIKPNQIGSHGNFAFSLDVQLNDDAGDALITSSPTWTQVLNDWSDPNLLAAGVAFGSPGSTLGSPGSTLGSPGSTLGSPGSTFGSPGSTLGSPGSTLGSPGSTFGEQDADTASANGNTPTALHVTSITVKAINLAWSPPNLGTVNNYQVWRGTCTLTPCTITNSSPSPLPGGQVPGSTTTFSDLSVKNNVTYLYFVEANITYPNQRTSTSGPSNTVIVKK